MSIAPTSLILVAVLPSPRDLEIARLLGWYRIPFRTAPKVVAVDYLAFYQPGSFDDGGTDYRDADQDPRDTGKGQRKVGRIQFTAVVRGHELTTRAELLHKEADHPRAGEEYYKIQLGPLEQLPAPILAEKWRRITFFYTTGEYLLKASTIHELVVQSGERELLWQSLRERANQSQAYQSADLPDLEMAPELLTALLGIHDLMKITNVSVNKLDESGKIRTSETVG